jgi:hypothetical protein
MKMIAGIALILIGLVLGLYVGIWLCFIGGIIGVIEQIRAETLDATIVAISIAKILFAGLIGWVSAIVPMASGMALMRNV